MTASDTLKNLQIRQTQQPQTRHTLQIGWAEVDITPQQPVSLSGHFELRISEGVADPLSVTAWAVENGSEQAVFVSCDVVAIPDDLRDDVRARLSGLPDAPDPRCVILHATHTHYAPEVHVRASIIGHTSAVGNGVELDEISPDIMAVDAYAELLAERITEAVLQAWRTRAPGGVSYGHGFAVIGRNRRWVDREGLATMHGLNESTADRFRYIDGYEDHALNVMAAYDAEARLTGLVVNFACPAQTPGNPAPNRISADFWQEIRAELRRRLGERLFILPQCSFAGDQTAYEQFDKKAEQRMLRLKGWTKRQAIAAAIGHAVEDVLSVIGAEIEYSPLLLHHTETIALTANRLTKTDARTAELEADKWREQYELELAKLDAQPELRLAPRWYSSLTSAIRREQWVRNVCLRYERQKTCPTLPAEVHVVRLGEVLFASVPFEVYLDYGVQLKARSPAVQTFLVQLAGDGTYVPTPRSLAGGGYGSLAASNPVGAEGGQQLAEALAAAMGALWRQGQANDK